MKLPVIFRYKSRYVIVIGNKICVFRKINRHTPVSRNQYSHNYAVLFQMLTSNAGGWTVVLLPVMPVM